MSIRNGKLGVECLESRKMLSADVEMLDPPGEDFLDFSESPVRMPGDANLDGVFNSSDWVSVLQSGAYEDGVTGNSNWAEGDFDGDGDFTSSDLVLAMQVDGYEKTPPGQNPMNPFDTDGDGEVCPVDVILVANEVYRHPADQPIPLDAVNDREHWLDVNGDKYISIEDAEAVMGALPDSGPCDISLDQVIDQYGPK